MIVRTILLEVLSMVTHPDNNINLSRQTERGNGMSKISQIITSSKIC